MTTVQIFKEHPDRENIEFKVLPHAKENTHVSNDMCKALSETFPEFSNPANTFGMKFDFSLMHCYGRDSSWQMNIVSDLPMLQKAFSTLEIAGDEAAYSVAQANEEYLKQVYEQFPLRIEGYTQMYWRCEQVKNFLRNELSKRPLEGETKLGLVVHSSFLKSFTAKGLDGDGNLIGGEDMKNC